jgi:hypothetical protein
MGVARRSVERPGIGGILGAMTGIALHDRTPLFREAQEHEEGNEPGQESALAQSDNTAHIHTTPR